MPWLSVFYFFLCSFLCFILSWLLALHVWGSGMLQSKRDTTQCLCAWLLYSFNVVLRWYLMYVLSAHSEDLFGGLKHMLRGVAEASRQWNIWTTFCTLPWDLSLLSLVLCRPETEQSSAAASYTITSSPELVFSWITVLMILRRNYWEFSCRFTLP